MTTLVADRRRALFGDGQESLFGGEAPARPAAAPPWERREAPVPESRPEALAPEPRREAPLPEDRREASLPEDRRQAPLPEDRRQAPLPEEPREALAPGTVVGDDRRSPRTVGAPLTGPTLDDVMSRVWEGLVTGLPAACPVCRGEVVPTLGGPPSGQCGTCGTTID